MLNNINVKKTLMFYYACKDKNQNFILFWNGRHKYDEKTQTNFKLMRPFED